MKTTLVLHLIFLCSLVPAFSQEVEKENTEIETAQETKNKPGKDNDQVQTLFGNEKSNGGYGALSLGYARIDGRNAFIGGVRGAWIIGHSLALGFGGYGFANEFIFDPNIQEQSNLAGGYGGFLIEPIVAPKYPVHVSFPILIGVGGVAYGINRYDYYWDNIVESTDIFVITDLGAELEFNLLKFFRLAIGGYYRYTTDINITYYNSDDRAAPANALRGWHTSITFKFGKF